MSKEVILTQDELFELRKWAKYGQLMAGFIHNLNTPLMGVSGRIELMEIKYPDVKGIDLINKHVDTINTMLQCTAYFTDKDTNQKEYDINLQEFIDRLDMFLKSNILYKHNIYVEKKIEEISIKTNVQFLFNALFLIINYLLSISEQEDNLIYSNKANELIINLERNEENSDFAIQKEAISESIESAKELLDRNNSRLQIENNSRNIIIKILIKA